MIVPLISIYLSIGLSIWLMDFPFTVNDLNRRGDKYRFGPIERLAFLSILHVVVLIFVLTAWPFMLRRP